MGFWIIFIFSERGVRTGTERVFMGYITLSPSNDIDRAGGGGLEADIVSYSFRGLWRFDAFDNYKLSYTPPVPVS